MPSENVSDAPAESWPVDPVPRGWPKSWRKAVESFRGDGPDAFSWSCDWYSSDRVFRKTCESVLAVLELRHGECWRRIDWLLIPVRGRLWAAFLEVFGTLPQDRRSKIATNVARCNKEVAVMLIDRRLEALLETTGGQVVWNELEPFDRTIPFDELARRRRLRPDLLQARFGHDLVVDVSYRRPGGCCVSVVDDARPDGWVKENLLYRRQVEDAATLDAAVQEAVRVVYDLWQASGTTNGAS